MLSTVKLNVAHKRTLQKEAIQYTSTMANISIKDDKSSYEKFFGVASPRTPETCGNWIFLITSTNQEPSNTTW
jgi:hypothetical protein